MSHPWDDVSDNSEWGIDPTAKKKYKKWLPWTILGFILFVLLIDFFRGDLTASFTSSDTPTTSPVVSSETGWAPGTFVAWEQDSNIAYKLTEKQICTSDYACLQFTFISKTGCPNGFYAALNWLDGQNGAVISYDNSALPALLPMQEAKLTFEDIEGNAIDARMAEIKCY